jgi:hypothetical protein
MAEGSSAPCWCTRLPPVVPVPAADSAAAPLPACWCPACLEQHIAQQHPGAPGTQA